MSDELKLPQVISSPKLDNSRPGQVAPRWRHSIAADVPHLDAAAVRQIADVARSLGRGHKGERDRLLICVLFDACLRVSEALRLTQSDIHRSENGYRLRVMGKGHQPGEAVIGADTAAALYAYSHERGLQSEDRFFPITRKRAHQIIQRAFQSAGVAKPAGTGHCHVLRHSGAIARLRASRNPKSIQDQLRHSSPDMTLRYWKTLEREAALQIQEGVDPWS